MIDGVWHLGRVTNGLAIVDGLVVLRVRYH